MNNILSFLPAGWGKHKGGGEWAGPCPRCGGNDRFIVWPEHRSGATGGKYLCRGCAPEGGDCIQFLRDFHGMSYPEACDVLAIEARTKQGAGAKIPPVREQVWTPEPERLRPGLQAFRLIGSGFFRRIRAKVVRAGGKQHFYTKHSIGADALTANSFFDRVNAVFVRGTDEHVVLRCAGSISVWGIPLPLVVFAGTGNGYPGFELLNTKYGEGHGYILPSVFSESISALAQRTPSRFPWRVTS